MLKTTRFLAYGMSMAFLVLVVSGCASIVAGTSQNVDVSSTPPAQIVIKASDGKTVFEGHTPAKVNLPKKFKYTVEVSLEGYQTQTIPINQSLNWAATLCGNALIGGLITAPIFAIIDMANGSAWNLAPNDIQIKMVAAYNGDTKTYYAVFVALDDQNKVRTAVVPMTKI